MSDHLLEGRHLTKEFPSGKNKKVMAVSDVSLYLDRGEILGLVGESGCGKSTLGRLLIRLLKATSGELYFCGEKISGLSERQFLKYRKQLQIIFQDPYASLDPRMTVRSIIAEPLVTYRVCSGSDAVTEKVLELMHAVGVPEEFLYRFPHQFSGGQRQRIGIARAIALDPPLIVCDEPVSALDVSVQNQILNLLRELKRDRGLSYLFISHDLSVVRQMADRVCVMFLGKLCEIGRTEEIYQHPLHPYTRFLLNSIPVSDPHLRDREPELLSGEIPSPSDPPPGCRFHTRCPYADKKCREIEPELQDLGGRQLACHHPLG